MTRNELGDIFCPVWLFMHITTGDRTSIQRPLNLSFEMTRMHTSKRKSNALAAIIIFISVATAISPGLAAPTTSSNDPTAVVKAGVSDVLTLLKDKRIPLKERRDKLRVLASGYFDFQDMARSALGYHWHDLSARQRGEFVPLFADFIQDAYLSKMQESTVDKVRQEANTANIQFTRQIFDGSDYAQVFSSIVLQDQKDPLQVNYMMHRVDGQWRVYDVTVDAISVIANYRNQFNRVINNDGYDKLVADLKAKQQQLQEYMEHPPRVSGSS